MLFAIPCLLHFMISYVHFFCSFYFITDWTDLYYGRMNQQQVFFSRQMKLFLIDCYCTIIVTFGFQSVNFLTNGVSILYKIVTLEVGRGRGRGRWLKGQHYKG